MGSIELKLNVSRLDLIIAAGVVLIAAVLIVGFVIWLVKSGRQNRALKSIDSRLASANDCAANLSKGGKDNEKIAKHTVREYVYIDKGGESKVRVEEDEILNKNDDNTPTVCKDEKNSEDNEEDIKLETQGEEATDVDVMAEIRKMLKETESYQMDRPKPDRYNVGKSGKAYTREDVENIIRD